MSRKAQLGGQYILEAYVLYLIYIAPVGIEIGTYVCTNTVCHLIDLVCSRCFNIQGLSAECTCCKWRVCPTITSRLNRLPVTGWLMLKGVFVRGYIGVHVVMDFRSGQCSSKIPPSRCKGDPANNFVSGAWQDKSFATILSALIPLGACGLLLIFTGFVTDHRIRSSVGSKPGHVDFHDSLKPYFTPATCAITSRLSASISRITHMGDH